MTNFNKTSLSPVEEGPHYGDTYNRTSIIAAGTFETPDTFNVIFIFSLFICLLGLVGNGIVICLLGFHIKKSPFTTFILNLAVADFGVLLFGSLDSIAFLTKEESFLYLLAPFMVAIFMHTTSQLLLTAISIDRCVSVLFPIWHRCHRPPHLSTTVCALIWVLSCLPYGSLAILHIWEYYDNYIFIYHFISVAVLSLPLVTVSTMVLLGKLFCQSQQRRRGRLLTIICLTLFFFLIFAYPLNAIYTFSFFISGEYFYLLDYGYLCAYLNSCVNPVIYFLVGRKKRGRQRQSLKVVLQRAFQEEEEHRGEWGTMTLAQ